jgi:hypothetical protein
MTRRPIIALACLALAARAGAQESLLPSTGWGINTIVSGWHFSTPLKQAGGYLADVAEVAIPFGVRAVIGSWSMDFSGAAAAGVVHLAPPPDVDFEDRVISIYGPTDVKVRLSGPLFSDATLLTIGANIPSGKIGLNADETNALQIVSAPALQMPIGSFGNGPGATVGLIRAIDGDGWALALGVSGEKRTEYSPIALALSAGKSETKVTPGTAAHVTLGLDRTLGEGRMNLLVIGDVFTKDKVRIGTAPTDSTNDYKLGPQVNAIARFEFGASSWRESSLNLAVRRRSEFSDAFGNTVTGSAGTYLEGSLGGVLGGSQGAGLIIGVDGHWHSGLTFTDAMVGAAATTVGALIGVEGAGESSVTRFFIRGQYGTFDTGVGHATGMGASVGFSVGARRGGR